MTYLEHIAKQKLARPERMGLAYRWLDAFAAAVVLWLILLSAA